MLIIWIAVGILVLAVLVLVLIQLRGRRAAPAAPGVAESPNRVQEHEALDRKGSELLRRRAQLDTRRGPLGGDGELYEALDQLTARREQGQISEQEYEAEKLRLLGG
ncbi:MAG: hypothetical protein ACRDFS_06645 [Chloroflexota bacterium]